MFIELMANRSDRRLINLSNWQALEAVAPIRTRRADFHQGPEHSNKAPRRGRIYDCNRLRLTLKNGLARGWVHISQFEFNSLRHAGRLQVLSQIGLKKARFCGSFFT